MDVVALLAECNNAQNCEGAILFITIDVQSISECSSANTKETQKSNDAIHSIANRHEDTSLNVLMNLPNKCLGRITAFVEQRNLMKTISQNFGENSCMHLNAFFAI